MNHSQKMLDTLMKKTGMNISETAKHLKMLQPNVSKVRSGEKRFTNEQLVVIAETLDMKPEVVLMQAQMDKAKTQKEKDVWVKLLTRIAATILVTTTSASAYLHDCVQCIFIKRVALYK